MRSRTIFLITALLLLSALFPGIVHSAPSRSNDPVFMNSGVSPSTGYNNTIFNFTTTYMDLDEDAPLYIAVYIDGYMNNMARISGGNYSRGVQYYYNTYLSIGNHTYLFYGPNSQPENPAWDPASGNYTLIVRSNVSYGPVLSNGGHSPSRPTVSSGVNFTVTYSDRNGSAPDHVNLTINDLGVNTSYKMNVVGSSYSTGVTCYRKVMLDEGSYEYLFVTKSKETKTARLPSSGTYKVVVVNASAQDKPPVLWNHSISPSSPVEGQRIFLNISYKDSDGDPPINVTLCIISDDGYNNVTTRSIVMKVVGNSYETGVLCTANTTLSNMTHRILFTAKNRNATVYYNTYLSVGSNPMPSLSDGKASPSRPVHNQTVNFTVVYKDPAGTRWPTYVNLVMVSPVSSRYVMSSVGSNLTRGVTYYCNRVLTAGSYTCYFEAAVGNHTTRYPLSSNLVLQVSQTPPPDRAPVLSRGTHSPSSPTTGDNITFSVLFTDADGDAPSYIRLNIADSGSASRSFSVYQMRWSGTSYKTGVKASFGIVLKAGTYMYFFSTASGKLSARFPVQGYLAINVSNPPPRDNPPVLSSPGVSPSRPDTSTPVKFTITYSDRDGDVPSYVRLNINSGQHGMRTYGRSYNTGVVYYCSLNLAAGNYTYYYTTLSRNLTARNPSRGSLSLTVFGSGGGNDTNRNIGGYARISLDEEGGVDMGIFEIDEGMTIEVRSYGEGVLEIVLSSEEPVDRVVHLEIDAAVLGGASLDRILLYLDGNEIRFSDLEGLLGSEGDEPLYHITLENGTYELYLYLPKMTSCSVMAVVNDEGSETSSPEWAAVIGAIIVVVLVAVVAIFYLGVTRKKRKVELYYKDFDIGMNENEVKGGSLDDDPDWDDLL